MAQRGAVADQSFYFSGLVKHRINAKLGATQSHFPGRVVAENHQLLQASSSPAGFENSQTTAAFQKNIHDRQIPLAIMAG